MLDLIDVESSLIETMIRWSVCGHNSVGRNKFAVPYSYSYAMRVSVLPHQALTDDIDKQVFNDRGRSE